MKAMLVFKLPEEDGEHQDALRGTHYRLALEELDNWLRGKSKYEEMEAIPIKDIRQKIRELASLSD